jgi:histidine triad (HIT) family protein
VTVANCLFCKVIKGEIPAAIVHQDDTLVAFSDINPQAPMHVLIVPRQHIPTLNDVRDVHDALVGSMIRLAARLAADRGYAEGGYRTVFNCNADAGQSVFHIHLHLLAGRRLGWPPG